MVDLLLIVHSSRGLGLTLLRLLYSPLFSAELFMLNLETRRFDVVRVVLLEFSGFNGTSFLKNDKMKQKFDKKSVESVVNLRHRVAIIFLPR